VARPAAARYWAVTCPRCGQPLDHASIGSGREVCRHCGGAFQAARFDPPVVAPRAAPLSVATGATTCANHPANLAETGCERCGVFMCSLCRIDIDGLVLCPSCFDRLSAEGALPSAQTKLRDYGRQASVYALGGILLWFFAVVFGPLAVYFGARSLGQIRAQNESEGRLRAWLSIVVGVLETGGSLWLLSALLRGTI